MHWNAQKTQSSTQDFLSSICDYKQEETYQRLLWDFQLCRCPPNSHSPLLSFGIVTIPTVLSFIYGSSALFIWRLGKKEKEGVILSRAISHLYEPHGLMYTIFSHACYSLKTFLAYALLSQVSFGFCLFSMLPFLLFPCTFSSSLCVLSTLYSYLRVAAGHHVALEL